MIHPNVHRLDAGLFALAIVVMAGIGGGACDDSRRREPRVTAMGWPFDNQEAARRQTEAAELLDISMELTLDLGGGVQMELVLIPAGEFVMGSPPSESGRYDESRRKPSQGLPEGPQHRVKITKPFYMGKFEVTRAQWQAVTGLEPGWESYIRGIKDDERLPVFFQQWHKCQEFCRKLGQIVGRTARLPTEAEWEYACRAGSATRFSFGDDIEELALYAWAGANPGEKGVRLHSVGKKNPNGWGLYDMHGNVWEWCHDHAGEYSSDEQIDPSGPVSTNKLQFYVMRGGSFFSDPGHRSAIRRRGLPEFSGTETGFRVVVETW